MCARLPGEQEEDLLGVGGEGGEDVGDGGELEAAAGTHHHALATRLLTVRQERRRVEPDEVEPKRNSPLTEIKLTKNCSVSFCLLLRWASMNLLVFRSLHILRRCKDILI